MNLRKRAISGIMLAGSMVVMCAIADAASTVSAEAVAVVADTRTDLATDGTAGVVAQLNQVSTDAMEMAAAGIEHSQTILVASADEEAQGAEDTDTAEDVSVVQNEAAAIEESTQVDSEEDGTAQDAGTTEDLQETVEENTTDIENTENTENTENPEDTENTGSTEDTGNTENTQNTEDAGNTENTENTEDTGNTENTDNTEDAEWQNRLMADVDEFLYVRASGDADAEIIGKLYKGDVAEVVESGDTWTHVVSGDVDGYVNNDYCVSGEDALAYAQENVETEAQVNTNGLRVRNAASEDASVITAVSEGTTLTVDTDAESEDGWVAVKYKGQTAYVSADYVTTELALGEAVTIEEEKAALAKKAEEEAAAKVAQTTETSTVQNASVSASYDDVTLLAALIQCEAGNECYEGQLAVGAVVMNRLRSGAYPSSISGVIYQSGQFPPAGQGMVASIAANGPKGSCIQAAQQALGGSDNTGGATCFSRASSGRAGVVIGNHVFY